MLAVSRHCPTAPFVSSVYSREAHMPVSEPLSLEPDIWVDLRRAEYVRSLSFVTDYPLLSIALLWYFERAFH